MAGHSHWSTIKRLKGAVDGQRCLTLISLSPVHVRVALLLQNFKLFVDCSHLKMHVRAALYAKMSKQLRSALDHGGGK